MLLFRLIFAFALPTEEVILANIFRLLKYPDISPFKLILVNGEIGSRAFFLGEPLNCAII